MKPTFNTFTSRIKALLDNSARQKSYNDTGTDGPNQLFDFIHLIAGMGHALGEIIYKVIRYQAKGDPEDVEKIAAWAYLVWRKHHESRGWVRTGIRKRLSKASSRRGSTSKRGSKTAKTPRRANRKGTRRASQTPWSIKRRAVRNQRIPMEVSR